MKKGLTALLGLTLCSGCLAPILKSVQEIDEGNYAEKVSEEFNVIDSNLALGRKDLFTAEIWPATVYGRAPGYLIVKMKEPVPEGSTMTVYSPRTIASEYFIFLNNGNEVEFGGWGSGDLTFYVGIDNVRNVLLLSDGEFKTYIDAVEVDS